jgi:hypothetical protein
MRGNPYKETNLKDLEINSLKEENQKLRSQLEVKPSKFKLWFLKSWSLILMGMLSAVAVFIIRYGNRTWKVIGASALFFIFINFASNSLYKILRKL